MPDKIKNVILGCGEIAGVISRFLIDKQFKMYDKGDWETTVVPTCDILHITIPYSHRFVNIVNSAVTKFQPYVLIIHSTVAPFTTEKIMTRNKLYSPVMGRHGHGFEKSVKSYVKFVAGDESLLGIVEKNFDLAISYWGKNTAELEYAKVMSTTRMYWDLLFNKVMEKDCEKHGFVFDKVNEQWTRQYNVGMFHLNNEWCRPIYNKMETEVPGGHCLSPNIKLFDNAVTRYLKAHEEGILYTVTKGEK